MRIRRLRRRPALGRATILVALMAAGWLDGCGGRVESVGPGSSGGTGAREPDAATDGAESHYDGSSGTCEGEGGCTNRSCAAMSAVGSLEPPSQGGGIVCPTVFGWAWDGAQCFAIVGCSCEGRDCGRLFARKSQCLAYYDGCRDGG
jgi:hypothetical protein